MRRSWVVGLLVTSACAGGQTGEITVLTDPCHPIGDPVPVEATELGLSANGTSPIRTSAEVELEWFWEDGSTQLASAYVEFEPTGEPGTMLGGPACTSPVLEVPVVLSFQVLDALDEPALAVDLTGSAVLVTPGSATVSARAPFDALDGALPPDIVAASTPHEHAELVIDLMADADALHGFLLFDDGTATSSAEPIAFF